MTVKLLALLRPSRGSDSVRRARVGVPGCRSCRCRSVESNRLKSEDAGDTRVFRGVFPGFPVDDCVGFSPGRQARCQPTAASST